MSTIDCILAYAWRQAARNQVSDLRFSFCSFGTPLPGLLVGGRFKTFFMTIYCELLLDTVRIKIDDEEIAFQVSPTFYDNKMFKDSMTSTRIKGYVHYHKTGLGFFEKLRYPMTGNKVYMLVNANVQERTTIRQIHDYAAKIFDGRSIFIIPKPVTFDSTVLENVAKIRTEYIKGSRHGDTSMTQITTAVTSTGR